MADLLKDVQEMMPWDLEENLKNKPSTLIVDVREKDEFNAMHIKGSLHIPRGILESACEWDFDETEPALVQSRDQNVIIVCRSGHRSLLAAYTLSLLGFNKVASLKTGLRGWNDFEKPMVDIEGNIVDIDFADECFTSKLREDQRRPI